MSHLQNKDIQRVYRDGIWQVNGKFIVVAVFPDIGLHQIAAMLAMPAHTPPIFALIPASLASAIHARDFIDAVRRISRFRIVSAPREVLVEENVGAVTCVVRATRPEETGEDVPAVIVDADFYAMVLLLRRVPGTLAVVRGTETCARQREISGEVLRLSRDLRRKAQRPHPFPRERILSFRRLQQGTLRAAHAPRAGSGRLGLRCPGELDCGPPSFRRKAGHRGSGF